MKSYLVVVIPLFHTSARYDDINFIDSFLF